MKKTLAILLYIGDYTQLYGEYDKPLSGSPLNNQDPMECQQVFFSWLIFQK